LSATVTSGIVSALNRPVRTSGEASATGQSQDTVINAVQTDAAINPGNSGGALVDMNGSVIGINSAIASLSQSTDGSQPGSIGVGFAIPVDQAKRIAQEIIDTGKATHAVLGASVGDAAEQSSQIPSGAKIASVTPGSGAESAGLQAGDVITGIGNQSVESADALIAAVRSSTPNSSTQVTFTRDGESKTVSVTLGSATAN
jgi:putative serine protease PepD